MNGDSLPVLVHKTVMSGTRDYKSLVSSHRLGGPTSVGADEAMHKQAVRFMNGVQSNKYKAVDYDQLKMKAQEMKFKGNKSLIKIKQIEQAAKDTKTQNMLKQHKAVWMKELAHLNSHRRKHSADVDLQTKHGLECEDSAHLFDDIEDYSTKLGFELTQFKKSTVDPIWELREDLQFWIAQISAQRKSKPDTAGDDLGSPDEIMQTILSVQDQQRQVLERLRNEQISLEQELCKGLLGEINNPMDVRTPHTGIPNEAISFYCPHEELKVSVLQEFLLVDQKYTERLDNLDETHADIVCYENGGWDAEEHFQFKAILDQHPFDLQHRRTVYIDRLRKQFPDKARTDLVEHEDWVLRSKNYIHNKKSLVNDWYRDRKELLVKAQAVFHQAQIEEELQQAKEERTKQQKDLCDMLYQQVRSWREERMEAMMIRQRLLDEEMRVAKEQRAIEEEKAKKKRAKEKEKIHHHQEKLNAEKRKQAEVDRIRLEELQEQHAKQALVDAERVRYREQLELERLEVQRVKKEQMEQEELEKEARLEALRETVRVVAEPDPYRVIKDTQNWHNRRAPQRDNEFHMHQPLFDIHTFNSNQIASDPRVKLETKLREAGVHDTNYARHVLSKAQPLQPPRKDTLHTLKLGD